MISALPHVLQHEIKLQYGNESVNVMNHNMELALQDRITIV